MCQSKNVLCFSFIMFGIVYIEKCKKIIREKGADIFLQQVQLFKCRFEGANTFVQIKLKKFIEGQKHMIRPHAHIHKIN